MLLHNALYNPALTYAWGPQRLPCDHQLAISMFKLPPARYPASSQNRKSRSHLYVVEDRDINIDDVLLEAENALLAAEESLSAPKSNDSTEMLPRTVDAIASSIGGIILGALLGTFFFKQIPDLEMLIPPFILPILFSFVLGTVGFASGFVNSGTASIVRTALGGPVKRLLSSLGVIALEQVEKSAQEVKSIPSRMVESMTKKVEEVYNGIIGFPSRLLTATKEKVASTTDGTTNRVSRGTKEKVRAAESTNMVVVVLAVLALPLALWICGG